MVSSPSLAFSWAIIASLRPSYSFSTSRTARLTAISTCLAVHPLEDAVDDQAGREAAEDREQHGRSLTDQVSAQAARLFRAEAPAAVRRRDVCHARPRRIHRNNRRTVRDPSRASLPSRRRSPSPWRPRRRRAQWVPSGPLATVLVVQDCTQTARRRRRLAARPAHGVPLPDRRAPGPPEGSRRRALLLRARVRPHRAADVGRSGRRLLGRGRARERAARRALPARGDRALPPPSGSASRRYGTPAERAERIRTCARRGPAAAVSPPIISRHARLPQPAAPRPRRPLRADDRQLRRRPSRPPGDARAARLGGGAPRPAGDGADLRAESARLLRAAAPASPRRRRRASRRCATSCASSSAAASRRRW